MSMPPMPPMSGMPPMPPIPGMPPMPPPIIWGNKGGRDREQQGQPNVSTPASYCQLVLHVLLLQQLVACRCRAFVSTSIQQEQHMP